MVMGVLTLTIPLVTWLGISFNTESTSSTASINLVLVGGLALLALPVFPLLYVYANYRHHFSARMEQRLWSLLVMLVYVSIILVAITAAITVAGRSLLLGDDAVNLSLITSTIIGVAVALRNQQRPKLDEERCTGDFETQVSRASVKFSAQMTELTDPGELETFLSSQTHAQSGRHCFSTVSGLTRAVPKICSWRCGSTGNPTVK